MSLPNIAIFTVYAWQATDDGYKLHLHLVAGFDSADAERRIRASSSEHLNQKGITCYITTDSNVSNYHAPDTRLYANGGRHEDICEDEYLRWVKTMTKDSYSDGEKYPANVRKI